MGRQEAKSLTIKNNHEPEWNFKAIFDIDESTTEGIKIAVFNDNQVIEDSLGNKFLDTSYVQNQKQLLNQWVPLEDCESGEVLLSAEFIPLATVQESKLVEPVLSKEDLKKHEPKPKKIEVKVQDFKTIKSVVQVPESAKKHAQDIASD